MVQNKRYIYILVPVFFAVATVVLSLVVFSSDGAKIRYIRLDFANQVHVGGNITLGAIKPYGFVVGNFGYRPFVLDAAGKPVPDLGLSSKRPFWFDILAPLNSWFGNYYYGGMFTPEHSSIVLSDLPGPVADYSHTVKTVSIAHWIMLCIVAGLAGLTVLLGFFTPFSSLLTSVVGGMTILNGLLALTTAALITGMFSTYCKRFNQFSDTLGITGSLEASGIGIEWGMAVAALLCAVSFPFGARMAMSTHGTENQVRS